MNPKALLLIALVALLVSGCSQSGQGRKDGEVPDRVKREEAKLRELASRHNARTDWMASLPDRGYRDCFTVDVARALVRTNEQSVAMVAELEDLSEKEGAFTGHFLAFAFRRAGCDKNRHTQCLTLRLELRCSLRQAEELLRGTHGVQRWWDMRFAVVARIESVSRPAFEATTSENGDIYRIDPGSMPRVFCATGSCIDLLSLATPGRE